MKVLSISDVITNSSSEVFIIKKEDLNKLSPKIQKNFEIIDEQNVIEKLLNYNLEGAIIALRLPEFLLDYDFVEKIQESQETHTDKEIVDVLYPMLKDIINIAIFIQEDNYEYGTNLINSVCDELNKKGIEYIQGRE